MDEEKRKEILEGLPRSPGVYLMKNSRGTIIYVGKAKDLKKRVQSYFTESTSDTRYFRLNIHKLVADLEIVLTGSEKEALLLENSLIKIHAPRFNVKLRDDKDFLCIRLDQSHRWPKLSIIRRPKKDGHTYFGPYPSAAAARETLRLVRRHFRIRSCTDRFMANRVRPCLQHQMHRCPGPCVLNVNRDEYLQQVEYVRLFLLGKRNELINELKRQMALAAKNLEYERAALLRDQIRAVEVTLAPQEVVNPGGKDQDVLGLARQGDQVQVALLEVREGRLSKRLEFFFTGQEFPDEEVLSSFALQYYESKEQIPVEVLLSRPVDETSGLSEIFTDRVKRKVRVIHPKRGPRRNLTSMADLNAKQLLESKLKEKDATKKRLELVQQRLRLPTLPRRIECVDISHLSGEDTVGSIAVIADGQVDRSKGRTFRVRTTDSGDDYQAIKEVLTRRFIRSQKEADWRAPDLLVIDGGRGQLRVAETVLSDLDIKGQAVVALAKERHGKKDTETDRVYLPGRKNPIALKTHITPLHILALARDEAHRLAIRFQRKTRRKKTTRSVLDDIPGVGPKTKQALLKSLGSIQRIRTADMEALLAVQGVGKALAKTIQERLNKGAP